jgi:hypothetical protein
MSKSFPRVVLGNFAGNQVGVDVVGLAVFANADGRDDRNKLVGVQRIDDQWIDADDPLTMPMSMISGDLPLPEATVTLIFLPESLAVFAAQAHRHTAMLIDHVDDFFVDLTDQDHFDDVQCSDR